MQTHHHPIKLFGLNLHIHTYNNKKVQQHTSSTQQYNNKKLTVHFTGNKPGLGLGLHVTLVDTNIDSGHYQVKLHQPFDTFY